jgi:hypothetical protein
MTIEATAPAIPQGQSEHWDRDAITALAAISVADVAAAALLWDSLAPRPFRGLLGAVPFEAVRDSGTFSADGVDDSKAWRPNQWRDGFNVTVGHERPVDITGNTATQLFFPTSDGTAGEAYRISTLAALPLWWFDESLQQYGTRNRLVDTTGILAALESFRDSAIARAQAEVTTLYTGATDIGLWQAQTADYLKSVELATVALGVGGTGRLAGDDLNIASDALAFHLTKLEGFARDIAAGRLNQEAAEHRGGLYPQSIVTGGFDDARRRSHVALDFKEERNVLDPSADHCETTPEFPGCADLTELGWSPIGTLPRPGLRSCRFMCVCHLEFRRGPEEEN